MLADPQHSVSRVVRVCVFVDVRVCVWVCLWMCVCVCVFSGREAVLAHYPHSSSRVVCVCVCVCVDVRGCVWVCVGVCACVFCYGDALFCAR